MLVNIFQNLSWSVLTDALIAVIPALICITFHELCHGFVAYKLGDPTAKRLGRLTFNPIKHIDPLGLIMMIVARFGWAKPVPVDMRNFKNPKRGMAITALAGPVSNLLLAALFLVFTALGLRFFPDRGFWDVILQLLYMTAYLNVAFAVFNIIPIPPLDGSKVLFSLLSDESYAMVMRYERYGFIVLIIVINLPIFSRTIGAWTRGLFDAMFNAIGGAVFRLFV
jgi:Zn-dependent protease